MNPLHDRCAGVLLHPTSLPGDGGCGNIGEDARRFVDFLQAAGLSVWQMLPLGPTHGDLSPYQCLSAHAGNTNLICRNDLLAAGWLASTSVNASLQTCLAAAKKGFDAVASQTDRKDYTAFRELHAFWLDNYALYSSIRQTQDNRPWNAWPESLRDYRQARKLKSEYAPLIEQVCFEQYLFFKQWHRLHHYARDRCVALFGDMPIYVAHDSADVWSNVDLFSLDEKGNPEVVAGVPPDYFSATGQRWGNPLYRWDVLEDSKYQWWVERFETQLDLFDLIRLDHFRGFEKYWEVPASSDTAIDGRWVAGPGVKLFDQLTATFGALPLVAEDLGIITPEVVELRLAYGFPGMKILQFAFDGGEDNPYLPKNHEPDSVVYTGTHDNDTTIGWYESLEQGTRERVNEHLANYESSIPWSLIEAAMNSVSQLAIIPMQDFLSLGSSERMNTPGTLGDNWIWEFDWQQIEPGITARIRSMTEHYKRLGR